MNIQLLDCTIRDGGYALEGIAQSRRTGSGFHKKMMTEIISHLAEAGLDLIEIGRVDAPCPEYGIRSGAYASVTEASQMIPPDRKKDQMYCILFRGPDVPLGQIPDWNPTLPDVIRVCIRYSEFERSLDYIQALCEKGYQVSIQCAVTMRYTQQDFQLLFQRANQMHCWAVYLVDTYGYMDREDVRRFYALYDQNLDPAIRIGFHAHNNLNAAYRNAVEFLNAAKGRKRKVLTDSCCMGMGQGAGNLQTEIISTYLNETYGTQYDFISILKACDIVEANFWHNNIWGYSTETVIAATYKIAYGYAMILKNQYHMTGAEIACILKDVPDEMRFRYTKENLDSIVRRSGYKGDKYEKNC